ncbi:MAG: GNAT family N-acetyltransferase [Myxococcales bacterium FL481]|nr:MAG: GNAT family N-acetyltransferase [Myxococcales bacterium FL481]
MARSPEHTAGPAYRLETARLRLRPWAPRDAPRLRASLDRSDADMRPFIPFMKHEPRSLAATAQWLRELRSGFDRDEHYRYAVFGAAGGDLVGEVMLLDRLGDGRREIGYWIDSAHTRRGYGFEASAAMVRVAFELDGVDRVELNCSPINAASVRLAQKLGFTHEATLARRFTNANGDIQDVMVWSLFAHAYPLCAARRVPVTGYDCLDTRLFE